jgi:hypothetical protein
LKSKSLKAKPKKSRPKISADRHCQEKSSSFPKVSTLICGVDISMSSIALAGIWYDVTLKKIHGPEFVIWRWQTNTHYFDRLHDACKVDNYIYDLIAELNAFVEKENMYFAVEEPWPLGMVGRSQSSSLKQQAEISGAFLGGLLRFGVKNIFQIPANYWRKIVADDLGITIHHSKWKAQSLCERFNCNLQNSGKFRAKEWALSEWLLSKYDLEMDIQKEIPDWLDIIGSSKGKIPRPEGSRAKAIQPDDRYDALAIMEWMRQEWLTE